MVPSGCRLFWLSTVTILLLGVAEAWMNCAWTGRVTTTGRPYSEYSSSYSNTDGASPVNDIIKDLQVFHLMPSDTQVISAYGYYVLAKIECDDQDPSQIARSLHMQGGTVVVTATVPSQGVRGNHLTWKELSFEGALVELNSSCPSSSVCDPAWVVPLPVSEDHHLLYLDVSTRGGTHAIQRLRFTVHSDGYWRDFFDESPLSGIGSEVSEQDLQQLSSSLESSPVYFLPSVASPSFFALTGRFAVFSNYFFKENVFVEISRVSVTKVCEGTKPFAITLADRLLYSDDQAVFEMFGRFASVMSHTGGFQPIEMDSCIHRIVIPPHSHLVEWSVYAIAGEESDEIYQAALINGQPLSFSMVSDTADAGPCHFVMSALQDVTSCNVRSGTPSATSSYEAVFLIETITAGEVLYCVLRLTGTFEEREWELLTTIPATNCTDIDSDSCLIDI